MTQRQKKTIIRGAQIAVAVMVGAGVAGALLADAHSSSPARITGLVLAAIAYIAWSLHGLRAPIQRLVSDVVSIDPSPNLNAGVSLYFLVQITLAAIVFTLSNHVQGGALSWLVLLPPVAHSVILLPRAGIVIVSLITMAVLIGNVAMVQGRPHVFSASLAFSFAVFFTLVFTMLATSAERSRGEVQKLADELAAANRRLREYAVEAEELAAARERNRLAREIHDSLGHYLTVVNMQLEAARAVQSSDPIRSRDAMEKAQSLTQEGLKEIRRSVAALRALPLENKPLEVALKQVVEESRASGIQVAMETLGQTRPLSPAAELTLFRTVQEALTNIRKHAAATSARVVLDYRTSKKVALTVSDNGAGTTKANTKAIGFGLIGLRERAQLLGGTVRTRSAPGAGFTLDLEIPE